MTATTDTQPEDLRNRMVEHIEAAGHLHSSSVEQALRTVPRHLFVPEASAEDAYANKAITTKSGDSNGRPASCVSVPTVVAMMLGQLDARPGDRVLEIGAGTGYNAALLAELVGETGQVTTIDIHPDVIEQARRALDKTGYGRVHVVTGDGALGDPDHAPYDRIIITVGPWDLPPAWLDQLAPGGRLVVPLHWRGQARSVAFVHGDGVLRAHDSQLCGFIPMIGDGQDGERTGKIADDVAMHFDRDQPIDLAALHGVLARPGTTVWSGASVVPNESTDPIWLRLTGTEPGTCRFAADPAAVESGLCKPAFAYRSPALAEGDSLAYLTLRGPDPDATERRWELGATGHGAAGPPLAERLCKQIRAWDRDRPRPHRPARHHRLPGRHPRRGTGGRAGHRQAVRPVGGLGLTANLDESDAKPGHRYLRPAVTFRRKPSTPESSASSRTLWCPRCRRDVGSLPSGGLPGSYGCPATTTRSPEVPSLWRCRWTGSVDPDRSAVHRMLSRWLDGDHHAQRKPWSWTGNADASDRELLIGLLDDRLTDRLRSGADATNMPVRQVAATSWSELRSGRARDCWQLEFTSPVTFRRGNRFLPWPSPSAVFGSLRAAWRHFGAPAVGDLELDLRLDPLVVTAVCGASRTERVTVHEQASVLVGGFVGTVRYAVDGGVADPQVIDALVALAPFSGVGAYTTRGFGGVRTLGQ